ncbi:MAG: ammonium transporter [Clostridiales bacterium]
MINTSDISFVLFASVIILLMTPAVAFFYAGLVEKKYVNTMLVQNFFAIPLITLVWAIFGFSLAYGDSILGGFIGGGTFFFLQGVTAEANSVIAPNIPFALFFVMQATFAIITPALMIGALVGRFRFPAFVLFFIFWSLLVYSPLIHWVWGGGFLSKMGYFDFAGGLPVHLIAGFSALAAAIAIGPRKNPHDGPCNLVYVSIGVGILWAGWLVFNASATMSANGIAALVALNTMIASGSGCIAWGLLAYWQNKKYTFVDLLFGAFAGLVISTPTSGFVSPWVMIPAGAIGATICYCAAAFRVKKGWDDTLDVWALHGVGGFVGVLLLGIFANPLYAPAAGLAYGNPIQLLIEAGGLVIGTTYCFVVTFILVKAINHFVPFRNKDDAPDYFGIPEE